MQNTAEHGISEHSRTQLTQNAGNAEYRERRKRGTQNAGNADTPERRMNAAVFYQNTAERRTQQSAGSQNTAEHGRVLFPCSAVFVFWRVLDFRVLLCSCSAVFVFWLCSGNIAPWIPTLTLKILAHSSSLPPNLCALYVAPRWIGG